MQFAEGRKLNYLLRYRRDGTQPEVADAVSSPTGSADLLMAVTDVDFRRFTVHTSITVFLSFKSLGKV
ncbi:hypothetical protein J6590_025589 [Homalodisca vitripennis]|nr:hypothetical protein J6590_025589 [Homalodisca vitripennis]